MSQDHSSSQPPAPLIDPEVFDRAHLARYTMDSAELEREILDLFLLQLPETLAMIATAATAADWKLATHSLKGSAAAVGARRIGRIAAELELLAATAADERARAGVELTAAVDEFRVLVASLFA